METSRNPTKHLVVVAVYYRLKFAVNDLCIKIFKQNDSVWEQCPSNSNYATKKPPKKQKNFFVVLQQSLVTESFAVC